MATARAQKRISNPITFTDVRDALSDGWRDFTSAPLLGLFFGAVYAVGGILLYVLLTYYRSVWLILPLGIGFPLVAPFVAAGTYETSRRLVRGEKLAWQDVLTVIFRQSRREFGWMAFVVLFIFWIWMYQIRLMIALFMGFRGFASLDGFVSALAQGNGLAFLAVGTVSGAILSFVLFCTTVIAMPMLLDREVDFITAMATSWRTVFENFAPMMFFAFLVAVLTFAALLPFFLGLLIVLPVLGHATWHLYARTVKPA